MLSSRQPTRLRPRASAILACRASLKVSLDVGAHPEREEMERMVYCYALVRRDGEEGASEKVRMRLRRIQNPNTSVTKPRPPLVLQRAAPLGCVSSSAGSPCRRRPSLPFSRRLCLQYLERGWRERAELREVKIYRRVRPKLHRRRAATSHKLTLNGQRTPQTSLN